MNCAWIWSKLLIFKELQPGSDEIRSETGFVEVILIPFSLTQLAFSYPDEFFDPTGFGQIVIFGSREALVTATG